MLVSTYDINTGETTVTTEADSPAVPTAELTANARDLRNAYLAESDWTQIGDATVSKSDWASYRTLLRNVPAQSDFPNTITWPTKPS